MSGRNLTLELGLTRGIALAAVMLWIVASVKGGVEAREHQHTLDQAVKAAEDRGAAEVMAAFESFGCTVETDPTILTPPPSLKAMGEVAAKPTEGAVPQTPAWSKSP